MVPAADRRGGVGTRRPPGTRTRRSRAGSATTSRSPRASWTHSPMSSQRLAGHPPRSVAQHLRAPPGTGAPTGLDPPRIRSPWPRRSVLPRPAGPRAARTARAPRREEDVGPVHRLQAGGQSGAAGRLRPGSSTAPPSPCAAVPDRLPGVEVGVRLRWPQLGDDPHGRTYPRGACTHERGHQSGGRGQRLRLFRGGAGPATSPRRPDGSDGRRRRGRCEVLLGEQAEERCARAGGSRRPGRTSASSGSSANAPAQRAGPTAVRSSRCVQAPVLSQTPVIPSIPSRMRSACPLCRAYSWIRWIRMRARYSSPERRSTPTRRGTAWRPRCPSDRDLGLPRRERLLRRSGVRVVGDLEVAVRRPDQRDVLAVEDPAEPERSTSAMCRTSESRPDDGVVGGAGRRRRARRT